MKSLLQTPVGKLVIAAVLLLALGTAVGLVALWPDGRQQVDLIPGQNAEPQAADVVGSETVRCRSPQATDCRELTIELTEGSQRGSRSALTVGDFGPAPELGEGAKVRVVKNRVPPGADAAVIDPYALVEVDRRMPMLWLVLAFGALVVVFGRARGALALVGLSASLLIVVKFVVPALVEAESPVAVATVGSLAVMLLTIVLAHGVGPKSVAAILGTAASLAATILLAVTFTKLAYLTGFSSEEANLLQANDADLSLEGLVLAGMVIGALGVLDDVTVSQASTVMALRRADPTQHAGDLYRGALAVGRDHVAATVNTLVLAYVGASLPILLVFGVGGTQFVDAISREAIAEQLVAMLVGSIGLILAVPVTTWLAAVLAARLPPGELDASGGHVH
ncbi:MAG: YibE/F family protein [Actinomycetota bacterium]|nr:YibE/F family protein [Actinomycetota bacterium]